MNAKVYLLVSAILCIPAMAIAQDSSGSRLLTEQANLAHAMTECAAYLTVISQIPGNSEALKTTYLGMADTVGQRAIYLTGDFEVYAARFKLAVHRMADEEMTKWDRVAVLNEKYGPTCASYVKALR